MPYINNDSKIAILRITREIEEKRVLEPGQAAFLITRIIQSVQQETEPQYDKAMVYHGLKRVRNFVWYAKVIGILECVKQEFYRRAVAPYEDKKKKENGDVF